MKRHRIITATKNVPRIGQQVAVAFLGGDIDRPIITGALYTGRGEGGTAPTPGGAVTAQGRGLDPKAANVFTQATDHRPSAQGNLSGGHSPAWHAHAPGPDGHRHNGALSGLKTKEFGGSGHNQLVFDDSAKQLRIQLATTQAHTQLNLGHLVHQADNYRGSFRGQGFELRTDAYGAIRAGQGLLLSTYGIQDGEPAFDFTPGQALLKQATQLAQTFSQAAATHHTVTLAAHEGSHAPGQSVLDDQAAPLKALHTALRGMADAHDLTQAQTDASNKNTTTGQDQLPHPTDPILALAAKAGLGVTAGEDLQLASGETLTLQSGQHTSIATGGHYRLHSGQALGVLAGAVKPGENNTGLNLIAAQGPIDLQAQSDTLKVQAKGELKVISANGHLDLAAAKAIRLTVAGGASIIIEGGNVEFKCPGRITVNAGKKSFLGPSSLSHETQKMPSAGAFDKKFKLVDDTSGEAIPDQPYRITKPDGSVLEGVSNTLGETALSESQVMAGMKLVLLPKKRGA